MGEDLLESFYNCLKAKNITVACAESITAGLLASTIASRPGASLILKGSIVTYNEDMKTALLNVESNIIDQYTAESMEVAVEMAKGLSHVYKAAELYIAVTGVASKSSPDYPVNKPVGQVFIAIIYKGNLHLFDPVIDGKERNDIRLNTVYYIFEKAINILLSIES